MRYVVACVYLIGVVFSQDLPTETSTLFSGSGNCATCHQPGSPNTSALLGPAGQDVSPVSLWRSTMMGNSTRDPFWRAKVSVEVTVNPGLKTIIEDKCTTCHSPLGRTEAIYTGSEAYSIEEMVADPLAMDGVSCTSCHQIKDDNLGSGESFSGHYIIRNDRLIYGPFQNPAVSQMQNSVNYTPTFSDHVEYSELCATCHTLFTPFVDSVGTVIGEAPEQTPYLEWVNSKYPDLGIECQTCHMPYTINAVVISNRPSSLGARSPFARHNFVGGNVFMLRLLKRFGSEIGVTASSVAFDSTIALTLHMLRENTAELDVSTQWISRDTLEVQVKVTNQTGHKFPAAYPSRRAWLELSVKEKTDDLEVFHSGRWDSEINDIAGLDSIYEPHWNVIRDSLQVQIYQNIPKDTYGNKTYTLLRIAGYLKDNRIPPAGFTVGGTYYDSTAIIGEAASDPNFNKTATEEGTGSDVVSYRIGGLDSLNAYDGEVRLLYQTLTPRFVEDLRDYQTPEVAAFFGYYDQMDLFPVTIDSVTFESGTTQNIFNSEKVLPEDHALITCYPNPFNANVTLKFTLPVSGKVFLEIVDITGDQIWRYSSTPVPMAAGDHQIQWAGVDRRGRRVSSGIYLVRLQVDNVVQDVKKLALVQ